MTDAELAKYLGIDDDQRWPDAIRRIPASRRAGYERLARLESEIANWIAGTGPRPSGVLIDLDRDASDKLTKH